MTTACLPAVLSATKRLKRLQLNIREEAAGVLPAVSRHLGELQELKVAFIKNYGLNSDDILALRVLPRLETLRLYGGYGCALEAPLLADRESSSWQPAFRDFVSGMSKASWACFPLGT